MALQRKLGNIRFSPYSLCALFGIAIYFSQCATATLIMYQAGNPLQDTPTLPIGSWNVTENNVTCILLKSAITLSINYTTTKNQSQISSLSVPSSAIASGGCGTDQYIVLTWNESANSTNSNTLTLAFHANETHKNASTVGKFAIVKVSAVIQKSASLFPNVTDPKTPFTIDDDHLNAFPTSLNHSFACESDDVRIESGDLQLSVILKSSQLEAFKVGDGNFNEAEHCAADEVSTGSVIGTVVVSILIIIFIALGIAAGVSYYLKKKRAAASAYETM